jgi:hypothetical protein
MSGLLCPPTTVVRLMKNHGDLAQQLLGVQGELLLSFHSL